MTQRILATGSGCTHRVPCIAEGIGVCAKGSGNVCGTKTVSWTLKYLKPPVG